VGSVTTPDRDLALALAAAARASLAAIDRGEWPGFPEDVEPPNSSLRCCEQLDVRWANAVCEFFGEYFFNAAHGDPEWAGLPPEEAQRRCRELLEQLEKGQPVEDPVILAYADPQRWPRAAIQRRPFGGRP